MKKYRTLNQVNTFIRSYPEGYQFSTKLISETLEIPENQLRRYLRMLKKAGYILQINSNEGYRVYIATPKFLKHKIRIKTILKKYKTIKELREEKNKPSEDISKKMKDQTKEIRELKYALTELKDEIIKRRRTNFNQSSQGTLFNRG